MTIVSGIAVMALLLMFWRRQRGIAFPKLPEWSPPEWLTYASAALLVPLFFAQAALLVMQARYENQWSYVAWERLLPIPVFEGHALIPHSLLYSYQSLAYSYAACAIACGQTLALGVFVLATHRQVVRRIDTIVLCIAAGLAAIALLTPALATTDPYEYAATSMIGLSAYAPPPHIFDGTPYASINAAHITLRGVIYGPLWVIINTFEIGWIHTIPGKIIALRIGNVALLAGTVWLFRYSGAPRSALVAFVVNPAIWFYLVLNPRPDLEGLAFVVAAAGAAQRSRLFVATLFVAAAGLIKAPFFLVGGSALVFIKDARTRTLLWLAAIALGALGSFAVGKAYATDVAHYLPYSRLLTENANAGYWVIFAVYVTVAIASLLAKGRSLPPVAWLFGQIAPLAESWYLLWGIPYAQAARVLTPFLLSLPLATTIIDDRFNFTYARKSLLIACTLATCIDMLRPRRSPTHQHEA